MMLRRALFPVLLGLCPLAAGAEVRALLVGVSDYLLLDADLKGPSQDAALMAEALVARGVAARDIVVLASEDAGLPQGSYAGAPVRAAILAQMASVAAVSGPGDTVVFYFSGHGAQAPDLSGDEGGGPDEILLPADAAGWKGAVGAVENAILDDELQVWAQGMLTRGVKVVGILDACHAGTGFRAVGGPGVARGLSEDVLGIPADVVSVAGEPVPLTGDFAFLYAAQADQRAFEYPLGDSGLWHGAFTLRLAEVLRAAPEASWAQVLAAASAGMAQGAVRQDPEGEGPLLSAPVFGSGAVQARFRVEAGTVRAGLLDGLAEGDELALYAAPAGGEPLGQAVLDRVEARRAGFAGSVPEAAVWAEVLAPAPPPPLRLAAPVRADPADGHDYAVWEAALAAFGTAGEADLVPILTGGQVALAGADGLLDPAGPGSTPRVEAEAGESPASALDRVLAAAGHSLRLKKLFNGVAGRSLTGKPALEIRYERKPGKREGAECGVAGKAAPVDPAQELDPCDELWLEFRNRTAAPLDVSLLYFDAAFGVTAIWPLGGLSNRLLPGEGARAGLRIDPGQAAGLEELMLLAVPVEPEAERVDLTRLATSGRFRGLGDPATEWFAARLEAEPGTARGFSLRPAPLNMMRQLIRVAPQDGETGR